MALVQNPRGADFFTPEVTRAQGGYDRIHGPAGETTAWPRRRGYRTGWKFGKRKTQSGSSARRSAPAVLDWRRRLRTVVVFFSSSWSRRTLICSAEIKTLAQARANFLTGGGPQWVVEFEREQMDGVSWWRVTRCVENWSFDSNWKSTKAKLRQIFFFVDFVTKSASLKLRGI